MTPITRFSLEAHAGPYAGWPRRSRLLDAGRSTSTWLPGYQLGFQFALDDGGFLLVSDWDCPFEEVYEVLLLSPSLRLITRASEPSRLGLWLAGAFSVVGAGARNLYCSAEVLGPTTLRLRGCAKAPHCRIEVGAAQLFRRRLRLRHED